MSIIQLQKISKAYGKGRGKVKALDRVDIKVDRGEFVAIMGPSGSGKSTLLNIIGLLDRPTDGKYILDKTEFDKKTNLSNFYKIRRNNIGFVFQNFNLLPRTNVLENVMMPTIYSGLKNAKQKSLNLIEKVGLSERIRHYSNELSGGEKQRVAIARSLINSPKIILADEPTGNLDSNSEKEIMKIFSDLNKKEGITIIMITHENNIANYSQRILKMKDGRIEI